MGYEGGGHNDAGARGEADDELELPQYEVPPKVRVEATKRSDRAEAVRQIAEVAVANSDGARAEVDSEARPDALREVEEAAQSRLPLDELAIRVGVVLMDVGLPVIQRPFAAR